MCRAGTVHFCKRKRTILLERCFGQKPYVSKVENSISALIIRATSQKLCIVPLCFSLRKEQSKMMISTKFIDCVCEGERGVE